MIEGYPGNIRSVPCPFNSQVESEFGYEMMIFHQLPHGCRCISHNEGDQGRLPQVLEYPGVKVSIEE